MSKTRIICHIVFATKNRQPTINKAHKRELFAYIMGVINNSNCKLHRINGMADHIHLLIDLHPALSLAELVKRIKISTNLWLKTNPNFPMFQGWNEGYFASSVNANDFEKCRQYIINQEEHHSIYPYFTELEKLILKNGMEWDPQNW